VSILPCNGDPQALGVIVERYWELDALRDHVKACRACASVRRAFAAITGSQGGRAARGAAKRGMSRLLLRMAGSGGGES
jgi:NAD-dependent oxidoreductase involved in siderophore biosynthesis